ncbi:MAG: M3 family oligoendopeptidase, partial [Erysipelotrichaceae bacterium]|nr:M3 family oligoendopeptidase [Erysipelotrichaceae bacterium]
LAQTVALQFWVKMQEDRLKAWHNYFSLVKKAGTMTFVELVKQAKLNSPFSEEALSDIVDSAYKFLDNFDVDKLK